MEDKRLYEDKRGIVGIHSFINQCRDRNWHIEFDHGCIEAYIYFQGRKSYRNYEIIHTYDRGNLYLLMQYVMYSEGFILNENYSVHAMSADSIHKIVEINIL